MTTARTIATSEPIGDGFINKYQSSRSEVNESKASACSLVRHGLAIGEVKSPRCLGFAARTELSGGAR